MCVITEVMCTCVESEGETRMDYVMEEKNNEEECKEGDVPSHILLLVALSFCPCTWPSEVINPKHNKWYNSRVLVEMAIVLYLLSSFSRLQ